MLFFKGDFLILSKSVIMPNGFLAEKTVGIRILFFYVTQLHRSLEKARTLWQMQQEKGSRATQ